ncbi:MAG: peptide/nickel transport system permease protein [Thermomicrobiales bacterium]|jgi:peptide/nickel transport system permease protein|nr:peptide/nickel transport system permease protein [Thermomicrobiales bacterium]MEA2523947.1 peptide/nickel transport system permease protein [Thermomicrobiales bacterium]MEA2585228.1 peptide/nickel transport system permease protein [Thermomicrobiales bacterium]MEA2593616.1 peptide/nickel transport system permease protein [Thermomicrobiales bacterium]
MLAYVVGRLLQTIPVLLLTSVIVFLFLRAVPGDPAMVMAGQNATPQQLEALRKRFGLDEPLVTQYATWMSRLARGDLGTAYVTERPISSLILQRLPATLHLAFGAMFVMLVVGMPLGILGAIRPYHPLSQLLSMLVAIALAVPTFWLGILLILVFAVSRDWLPASGYVSVFDQPVEAITRLILPSLTLGSFGTAVLIRFLKSSISEAGNADFVRTAYAKGLRERAVILGHVLRIALLPVVTILAIQFGQLLGGAVVTEAIFGWPGVGRLILDAIGNRDYLIVQSTMLLFVATFVVLNILADVCYALLDPRIRLGR